MVIIKLEPEELSEHRAHTRKTRVRFDCHFCCSHQWETRKNEFYHKWSSLDTPPSKCKHPPQKYIWSTYDSDLWSLTLNTFSAVPTHVINVYAKFRWNPCTTYGDIASLGICVNGKARPDGRSADPKTQAFCHLLLAAEAKTLKSYVSPSSWIFF